MSIPPQHAYTPPPGWPPPPGYPATATTPGSPARPASAPRSAIVIVTGIALILAAVTTGVHIAWATTHYTLSSALPVLEVLAGLAAAIVCFATKGGTARPAAGVAAGLLLVPNLSFLLLYLQHTRYAPDLGSVGNWLTIPATLAALVAIIGVLVPVAPATGPTTPAMPGGRAQPTSAVPHQNPVQQYAPFPQQAAPAPQHNVSTPHQLAAQPGTPAPQQWQPAAYSDAPGFPAAPTADPTVIASAPPRWQPPAPTAGAPGQGTPAGYQSTPGYPATNDPSTPQHRSGTHAQPPQ
ncbi:hypothetical protein VMT65_24880 [Nocardia sp. CDC153]|uniref:hypothetical protein n=1 Tax=Nocardia sp. CDC153 TaxID=3112167 RepID=UPI002DBD4B82|nr:hypothetical protein [Nocardia sp. CDC153]MEC3956296.1 hypothetical protein [Nocardia sp. CDC153]